MSHRVAHQILLSISGLKCLIMRSSLKVLVSKKVGMLSRYNKCDMF